MRLLAFSDIHHNLVAVRKLRAQEQNAFDAIIVAGDIGSKTAADFFGILSTFQCPVMYVYGNWDHELGYKTCFAPDCHLVHLNVLTIGDISFTGFSGCPTNWGQNPIARKLYRKVEMENKRVVDALGAGRMPAAGIRGTKAYRKYVSERKSASDDILRLNRQSLGKVVRNSAVDPRKCVVITHQRLARLDEQVPGALLHLFGHLHAFSEHSFRTTKYVNVAALDRPLSVPPRAGEKLAKQTKQAKQDRRIIDAGNYTTIEINACRDITVRCVSLAPDCPDSVPLHARR